MVYNKMIGSYLTEYTTVITLLLALIGTIWSLYRYFREGIHRPRIEFDIDCRFIDPHNDEYIVEFTVYAHNKGKIKFSFPEIRLRVLGIKRGVPLKYLKNHGKRLEFPIPVLNENIIPPKFKSFFVEPGVRQPISYITRVSKDISVVTARASFKYRFRKKLHTREKMFGIKMNENSIIH